MRQIDVTSGRVERGEDVITIIGSQLNSDETVQIIVPRDQWEPFLKAAKGEELKG